RHAPAPPADAGRVPELVPVTDVSRLSPTDQQRQLGLAYLSLLGSHDTTAAQLPVFRARARALLTAVEKAKMRDGATAVWVSSLDCQDGNHAAAASRVKPALETEGLAPDVRADGLLILANCCIHEGKYGPAIDALEKVTRLRRYSGDWRLLGMCYLEQNR